MQITVRVPLSPGPGPGLFRLEAALFNTSVARELDEDTVRTYLWVPPASYHDVIEIEPASLRDADAPRAFRRLVARAPGRRYEFALEHEYLLPGPIRSTRAQQLRAQVEALGGYWEALGGPSSDQLLIYIPPGVEFDPSPGVSALRTE